MESLSKLLIGIGIFTPFLQGMPNGLRNKFFQLLSSGLAESTETEVTGINDPAQDVKAVQDAMDKGGTFIFKGKFNLGEKERVIIKNDIKTVPGIDEQQGPCTSLL